jgi:hypothetical protein
LGVERKGGLSKEINKSQPAIIRHYIFKMLSFKLENDDSEYLKNREMEKKSHTCKKTVSTFFMDSPGLSFS